MRKIITFTGASGAGKDSMVDALLMLNGVKKKEEVEGIARSLQYLSVDKKMNIKELISHTTRSPRSGEKDGVAYHFITKEVFDEIEKVEETEYAGNYYCLSVNELESIEDNGIGVVIVDQHGVECIKKFVDAHKDKYVLVSVFLEIDEETSEKRMLNRGDNKEAVVKRLKQHKERNEYRPKNEDLYALVLNMKSEADFYYNVIELYNFLRPVG